IQYAVNFARLFSMFLRLVLAILIYFLTGKVECPDNVDGFSPTREISPSQRREPRTIIKSIPSKEQIVLLADFNARVGAYHDFFSPPGLASLVQEKRTITVSGCLSCAPT
ncbi:unnamed protein product, partial [Porites lobata]